MISLPRETAPGKVLVVVPAWNERDSIATVLAEIAAAVPKADVIVVDDGSSDGTSEVVRAMNGKVLTLPFNVGVGGAMRAGFLYALRKGYAVVVQVDADGQHNPAEIENLLAALVAGADICVGARFAGTGQYRVRGPRWLAMRMLAIVCSWIVGSRLSDVTSGFRASGARAIELFAHDYPPEYLGDTVESLLLAHRAGLKVIQVPVAMRTRMAGNPSQSAIRSTVYLTRAMLVLALAVVRSPPKGGAG